MNKARRIHRRRRRAFSLIEVTFAVAMGGVLASSVAASFKGALDKQAEASHDWQAFTIAQQQIEILEAFPTTSTLLTANSTATTNLGFGDDVTCSDITDTASHYRVNAFGAKTTNGTYDLCWKITDNNPSSGLKNIRVVVTYDRGGTRAVILQTVR